VTKEEAYEQVLEQAEALFQGQRNWVWYAFGLLSAIRDSADKLVLKATWQILPHFYTMHFSHYLRHRRP